MKLNLLLLLLMLPGIAVGQCRDDNSFIAFLDTFKQAVQKDDLQKIASMTRFPFEVRSALMDEKPIKVKRKQFIKFYKYMMSKEAKTQKHPILKLPQKDLFFAELPFDRIAHFSCVNINNRSSVYPEVDIGNLGFVKNKKSGMWQLSDGLLGSLASYYEENSEPEDDSWVKEW